MTEEATAVQAAPDEAPAESNPYNAKQTPVDIPRGVISADDGLAPAPKKEEVIQAKPTDEVPDEPTEEPTQQFKKVDYKKRYDDLKRHYDSKLNEFKAKESKMSQQIKEGLPNYTPPRTPEELATFKEEFPEVYDTIETIAHSKSNEQAKELQTRLDAIESREAKVSQTEAFSKLSTLQPDFEEIKSTQEFHTWVDKQPQDIQDWLYKSFNADLASRAIDLFKQDVGWKTTKEPEKRKPGRPKKEPSAADIVKVSEVSEPTQKEGKIWTSKEIDYIARHNPEEAEKLMDEWESAHREGRLVKG